jgi:asparagine synthase (glutamine-hydrolysing)
MGFGDELNAFLYADAKVYLADDILVKVDRMSMAHSLEVRVPLLDYRVAEFMLSLPSQRKIPGFRLKHLLKAAMRDVLPSQTLRKRKGGFNVPLSGWLRRELRPLLLESLAPARISREGVFNAGAVAELVAKHLSGEVDYSRNLWALVMFNVWRDQRPAVIDLCATSVSCASAVGVQS